MTLSDQIKEIQKQIRDLQIKRDELEALRFHKELVGELRGLIGKTFVFRGNSYSMGDKWDTYRRILDVVFIEDGAWQIHEQCEIDGMAEASISIGVSYIGRGIDSSWEPCSEQEYVNEKTRVQQEMSCLMLVRRYLNKENSST
jgi:hypothetical protein